MTRIESECDIAVTQAVSTVTYQTVRICKGLLNSVTLLSRESLVWKASKKIESF